MCEGYITKATWTKPSSTKAPVRLQSKNGYAETSPTYHGYVDFGLFEIYSPDNIYARIKKLYTGDICRSALGDSNIMLKFSFAQSHNLFDCLLKYNTEEHLHVTSTIQRKVFVKD